LKILDSGLIIKVRDSSLGRLALSNKCEEMSLKNLLLTLDVPTRWNSTFMMVKRCLDLKDAINLLINTDPLFVDIKISPEEWLKFEEICNFLEPLYELTLIMSSEKTPLRIEYKLIS
jgi:hypothetical protein